MKIQNVYGQQILDSRGEPTVECTIELENGNVVVASVPAGKSIGRHEAVELRDNDNAHFEGNGVLTAVNNIETVIRPLLIGKEPDIIAMDQELIGCNDAKNKPHLGTNTLLAVSIAIIRSQAVMHGMELYELINKLWSFEAPRLPLCMFNIINGGLHADSGLAFQEFMIMPQQGNFKVRLETADRIYHHLKKVLYENGYATSVGDEGGFAPRFTQQGISREYAALHMLEQAIFAAEGSVSIDLCLDVAASSFYSERDGLYSLYDKKITSDELMNIYQNMCDHYPLISIEDGLGQDDWVGWQNMTQRFSQTLQLVGDDIFVTNIARIMMGVERCVANAVLIKPNQIGTVSQAVQAIQVCKKYGYKTIISHRSGETNDTFISDLAVGTSADQFKAGACVRGERIAKYNRLLTIEKKLYAD